MTTLIDPAREQASAELHKQTAHSIALHERAAKVFPGGDFRRAAYMAPSPVYVERAEGAYLYDVDGNRMIDFNGNFTSMAIGHSHPKVVEAVRETAGKFMALASPTENAVELGELIVSRVPSVEKMRFACSGSEAVMFAIRGARAFTGRAKIMKMEGAYHGTYDPIEDEKAGIPDAAYADVVLGRYNDREFTERVLLDHREELAAVLVAVGYGSPAPDPPASPAAALPSHANSFEPRRTGPAGAATAAACGTDATGATTSSSSAPDGAAPVSPFDGAERVSMSGRPTLDDPISPREPPGTSADCVAGPPDPAESSTGFDDECRESCPPPSRAVSGLPDSDLPGRRVPAEAAEESGAAPGAEGLLTRDPAPARGPRAFASPTLGWPDETDESDAPGPEVLPADPAEPDVSAKATAGKAATATPMPSATAKAPTRPT